MDPLIVGVAVAAAGAAGAIITVVRRKLRHAAREENDRFVLRVQVVSPDDAPVCIGTSVETEELPSSAPVLVSVEATLIDDADNRITLPAGTKLVVRAFEGARRLQQEVVTTLAGTGRRFTFHVAPTQRFWILDAPNWQGCHGTTDPTRRTLPERPEGYEVTTRDPPAPVRDEDGAINVTMADITMPLWMHGLEGPDEWLLGARPAAEHPHVAVAAFSNPHSKTAETTNRDRQVDGAAFLFQDDVWLRSSGRATVGVPIAIKHARVSATHPLATWDHFEGWTAKSPPSTVFVWGAARADIEVDGYDVRLRSGADVTEAIVQGGIDKARADVLATLVARGAVEPRAPAVEPLPTEIESGYLAVCDHLILLILMHPNNQALPMHPPKIQREIVDLAKDLADAAPTSPVAILTWTAAAIYAYGCGGLDAERRAAVLAFVRARTEFPEDDAVRRVTPAILLRLGEAGEAAAACEMALARESLDVGYRDAPAAQIAYRGWLEKVLAKARAA